MRAFVRYIWKCVLVFVGVGAMSGFAQPSSTPITVCSEGPPTCQFRQITEAINAAPSGATIQISAGTFNEQRLVIQKSLTLRGAGRTATTLVATSREFTIQVSGEAQVTLEEMRLQGIRRQFEGIGNPLQVRDRAQLTLRAVALAAGQRALLVADKAIAIVQNTVINSFDVAVAASGNAQLTFSYNSTSTNSTNISLTDSAQATIEFNEFQGGQIETKDASQARIANNRAKGQFAEEAWEIGGKSRVEMLGNVLNGFAIYSGDNSQLLIEKNQISGGFGISVGGSASARIVDNEIRHSGFNLEAIRVESDNVVEIKKNQIIENETGIGVLVLHPQQSTLAVIESNLIARNGECGVTLFIGRIAGRDNEMRENGSDLCRRVPSSIRRPLVPPTDRTLVRVPQDYSSVQEAIDAVAPGGTVEISAGSYRGGLLLYKPVTLRGTGAAPADTVLTTKLEGLQAALVMINPDAGEITLENLKLTIESFDDLSQSYGSVKVHVRNVVLSKDGLLFLDKTQADLDQISIEEGASINAFDSSAVLITNSKSSGPDKSLGVIFADSRAHLVVQDSAFSGPGSTSIFLAENAEAQIERNTFRDYAVFVNMVHMSEAVIRDNVFLNSGATALVLGREDSRVTAIVEHNRIEGSKYVGIGIDNAAQVTLRENVISKSGQDGIRLLNAARVEAVGNTILDSGSWGIAAWSAECQDAKEFERSKDDLFRGYIYGSENELKNNRKGDLCGVPAELKKP